ncbi:MAG: CHASE2 domain-containing protein [Deltaproteobacteria bacterium]|nr:CHASE2 domain-containing protein [Deltaproteobacteria bacterium]TLN03946.1 MAG: CHASE2 domain-containing protein [bacterium]
MTFLAIRKALLAKPKKMYGWIFFVGIGFTFLLALLATYRPVFFHFLDYKIYDTLLRSGSMAAPPSTEVNPVIIDIDEKSLAHYGQWPWPRYRIAALLDKIRLLGATSITLDMVFPEPDRNSLREVSKNFQGEFGISLDLQGVPAKLQDNDAILADVLSEGPFILGYSFLFSADGKSAAECPRHPLPVAILDQNGTTERPSGLFRAEGATCSLLPFQSAVSGSGFFNMTPDSDGVLRRVPLIIEYQGKLYPSLPLATLMQTQQSRQAVLKTASGKLDSVLVNDISIPVDAKANILVRFHGSRKPFTHLSALDILQDSVERKSIEGRIVFVGTSAVGLEEYRTTPLTAATPGTEIHATIVDNMLQNEFFRRPYWTPGIELLLVLFCGILSALILSWTRSVLGLSVIAGCCAGLWLAASWALKTKGIFISPLLPLVTLGGNFTLLTFIKYWREEQTLKSRNRDLVAMQNFTIQCLAALTESRDSETGRHIERCQHYVKLLSDQMARNPRFAGILDEETIDLLFRSATLHDIGKVAVPDSILLKPANLTEDEYREMKKHTIYGREAIQRAEHLYGADVKDSFLQFGKIIAYSHHEKWNGTGYPEGLTGEEIPLFGRIMAVADVYDAIICKRRYKPAFSHEDAVDIIVRNKGSHFDPTIVEAFLEVQEEFHKVAQQLPDE